MIASPRPRKLQILSELEEQCEVVSKNWSFTKTARTATAKKFMGISCQTVFLDTASGAIIEEMPNIKSIFAILEPMILPNARLLLLFTLAIILTASSGAEVPKLTTVSPIIISETPTRFARALAHLLVGLRP